MNDINRCLEMRHFDSSTTQNHIPMSANDRVVFCVIASLLLHATAIFPWRISPVEPRISKTVPIIVGFFEREPPRNEEPKYETAETPTTSTLSAKTKTDTVALNPYATKETPKTSSETKDNIETILENGFPDSFPILPEDALPLSGNATLVFRPSGEFLTVILHDGTVPDMKERLEHVFSQKRISEPDSAKHARDAFGNILVGISVFVGGAEGEKAILRKNLQGGESGT